MRFIRLQNAVLALGLLTMAGVFANFLAPVAIAQSTVSGEITGTVTDISGAVVPKATVTLTSADLGVKSVTTTSSTGTYRFPLLRPATYKVTATATGFGMSSREAVVNLGQVTPVNIQLGVAGKAETIAVEADTELIHSESANLAETIDAKQVELLPNSGNDMTNFALTTPGVALSTGGGYGNFTSNGIGGMSNLYTVNGNDYNDPYLNLNNSGSSNMLLGSNEVQEASIVTNGYTAQYGRAAGTNMNFTTKSGTNKFHGDLIWNWNGTALNANDWFNKPNDILQTTTASPRPHAVSNQWAGDVGGPILKNKLFFYYDNEGIRYVLPSGSTIYIPSPAYQAAAIANLKIVSPQSVAFYQKAFAAYNGASGYSVATPVTSDVNLGCGDIYIDDSVKDSPTYGQPIGTTLDGIPLGTTCALQFRSNVNNLNTERLQTIRVDVNPNSKDKLNFRYKGDRGVQATSTDALNSAFSANSVQPSNEAQANWTRILNGNMVNQFIASDLHYVAKFGPPNLAAAEAVFPTSWYFSDGLFSTLGGTGTTTGFSAYPSGRVVEQYQFVDDFTWTKGSHGIKAGVNFRREDISDYSGSSGLTGLTTNGSMKSFTSGVVDGGNFSQSFSTAPEVPVASFSLGLYIQDEWRLNNKLKVTLALRADSNSNEVCQKNCFSRPTTSFESMDHTATTPYNTSIKAVKQVFQGLEPLVWGPRAGFDWTPFGEKTVIRGGFGLFADLYPGLLGSRAIVNLPNVSSFTITSGPISPDASGSVFSQASASNTALQSGYSSGGTLATIQQAVKAAGSTFSTPSLTAFATRVVNPKYLKWNLEIEHSIGVKTAVSVNYAGNHGYDLFTQNRSLNAYCTVAKCPNGFEDLPSAAPDPRFSNIREYDNGGIANYAGLTGSIKQRVTKGFTGTLNYTWSHTLDELYEGGIEPFNNLENPSLTVAIDPVNVRKYNYASADQDIRSLLSANFYWDLPFKTRDANLNEVFGGWTLSGTVQRTSGTPFSAYYTTIDTSLLSNAANARVLAQMNTAGTGNCGRPDYNSPCFKASQFQKEVDADPTANPPTPGVPFQMAWGGGYNKRRNNFTGPGYFDTDLTLAKRIHVTENGLIFSFAAEAINFFNHPNFDRPIGSLSNPNFGVIMQTVGQPNSPYGNFQGSAANGRIIEAVLKVKF